MLDMDQENFEKIRKKINKFVLRDTKAHNNSIVRQWGTDLGSKGNNKIKKQVPVYTSI